MKQDYQDFLRHRGLRLWPDADPRIADLIARRCTTADQFAAWTKDIHDGRHGRYGQNGRSAPLPASIPSTKSIKSIPSIPVPLPPRSTYSEIAANGVLALIRVASSLLDRQLAAQERAFLAEGGFTERLYRLRSQTRNNPHPRPEGKNAAR